MSSPLAQAIIGSYTAQFDPNRIAETQLLNSFTSKNTQEAVRCKADTISFLEGKIDDLSSKDKPNQTVLKAYTDLLQQAIDA